MIKFLIFLYKNREKLQFLIENCDKINIEKKKSDKKGYSLYGVPSDQISSVQEMLKKEV